MACTQHMMNLFDTKSTCSIVYSYTHPYDDNVAIEWRDNVGQKVVGFLNIYGCSFGCGLNIINVRGWEGDDSLQGSMVAFQHRHTNETGKQ